VDILRFDLARDELHTSLGGGLPAGSIMLIEAAFGSGKSVIAQRFCYGLLTHEHQVSYISTELTVKDFIDQMYSLDFPIATSMLHERLLFIPVLPLIGKSQERTDFLGRLMKARGLFESEIVFLDTFSALVKNSLDGTAKAIEVLGFFKKLSAMGKIIVITVEQGDLDEDVLKEFKAAAHIYFKIEAKQIGSDVARNIMVQRFQNSPKKVDDMVGFKVVPKVGIIIEITQVG